jgi:hypothetical protein
MECRQRGNLRELSSARCQLAFGGPKENKKGEAALRLALNRNASLLLLLLLAPRPSNFAFNLVAHVRSYGFLHRIVGRKFE